MDPILAKTYEQVKADITRALERRICHVFAVNTKKRDVTQRLKDIMNREGIRVEILSAAVPPEAHEVLVRESVEGWDASSISHPRLVATG
jgi:hypothetical protein